MTKHLGKSMRNCFKQMLVVSVGAALLASCSKQSQMKLGDDQYTVESVQTSSSNQSTSYPATIKGFQDVEVRPQVTGQIVKLCVDEGATVVKGQPLFQIDPTPYRAAVEQANASIAAARAAVSAQRLTLNSKKQLYKKGVIGAYEYETAVESLRSAQANLMQARAALITARQNLGFCTVKSPSNGVVGTFPYRLGSLVSPSITQPLTTVSEIGNVYVYFSMTEKQLLEMTKTGGSLQHQLAQMPQVKLQLADGSMYDGMGRIDAVSGVIDPTTGSVSMRAIFKNAKGVLRSGGSANIVFPYTMTNIIVIPQAATVEVQDKKFVYVLQSNKTVKYTEVQISDLDDGQNYIVTDGLKAGDQIVVEGVQNLKDGMKITPLTKAQQVAKFNKALKDQHDGNIKTAFQ